MLRDRACNQRKGRFSLVCLTFYGKCKRMVVASLTSKYQVTIPALVRKHLRLCCGDRLLFAPDGQGNFTVKRAEESVSDGFARKLVRSTAGDGIGARAQASRHEAAKAYRRRNG